MNVKIDFYSYYFLKAAIKITMLCLSWKKNSEKFSGLLKVHHIGY